MEKLGFEFFILLFFSPGTGAFWTASLLILVGYNLTKTVGITKL